MPKIALLSDIHGNIDALEAVISKEKADKWLCLGDIVGYNPDPEECVNKIKDLCTHVIAGNHDQGTVNMLDKKWFNTMARIVLEWTENNLSPDSIQYLKELPLRKKLSYEGYNIIIAHGYPDFNNPFKYIMRAYDLKNINSFIKDIDITFVGHTHVPGVFKKYKGKWKFTKAVKGLKINIKPKTKYIINVGSVGQPRDGNSQASYSIFHPQRSIIEIKRVDYDIKNVQEKIYERGLPHNLAQRLEVGR